jgi:hypothetical protein
MTACKNCGVSVGLFSRKKVRIDADTVEIYCAECSSMLVDATTPMWESPESRLLAAVPDFRGNPNILVYSGEPDDGEALIRAVDLSRREVLWERPLKHEDFEEARYGQHDGRTVFSDRENTLFVVDAKTGATIWEKPLAAGLHASPRFRAGRGLLVITGDRKAAYYDLASGEVLENRALASQDEAESLLDECVQSIDDSWDSVVCGEVQFEQLSELIVNTEIDSGYPRADLKLSASRTVGLEPTSMVSGLSLQTECRTRTVFDSAGTHEQELFTLSVEGWEFGSYCGIVGDKLVCWGSSEWGDDTTVGVFVFDPTTLNLEGHVALGTSDSSPDYAYSLGDYLCLSVDLVEEDEVQASVFVYDVKLGRMMMRVSDGRVYPGDQGEFTEQL